MIDCKEHKCNHKLVEFCKGCQKVYCKECHRSWQDECKLNHYYFTYTHDMSIPYTTITSPNTCLNHN